LNGQDHGPRRTSAQSRLGHLLGTPVLGQMPYPHDHTDLCGCFREGFTPRYPGDNAHAQWVAQRFRERFPEEFVERVEGVGSVVAAGIIQGERKAAA
jgi:hypothetical protein